MGRTVIREDLFPEIVELYNNNGKAAAYGLLWNRFGIRHPYFVLARIRECGKYTYDPERDKFLEAEASTADNVFYGSG